MWPLSRTLTASPVAGCAASTVTVSCPNGTHKYPLEQVGKGYFEVTGTLQGGGAITEMATVPMGEQLGACPASIPSSALVHTLNAIPPSASQTPTCTSTWSSSRTSSPTSSDWGGNVSRGLCSAPGRMQRSAVVLQARGRSRSGQKPLRAVNVRASLKCSM